MRTWFITGASRGFGALIAQEALAKGEAVVATANLIMPDRFALSVRCGLEPYGC